MKVLNRLRNIWNLGGNTMGMSGSIDFFETRGLACLPDITLNFDELDGFTTAYNRCSSLRAIINKNSSALVNGEWHIYNRKDKEVDDKYQGYIVISDEIKEDSKETIKKLRNMNIETIMLTGDSAQSAQKVQEELLLDKFYAELLPENKVEKVEEAITKSDGSVIFAGDGINDAPVLTRADAGIAMGGLGSDAAIEAADVVIMDDKPSKVVDAIILSKNTMAVVKQNISFAIGVKALFLILGGFGMVSMWGAVFADVGVSLIAVLNALRSGMNSK